MQSMSWTRLVHQGQRNADASFWSVFFLEQKTTFLKHLPFLLCRLGLAKSGKRETRRQLSSLVRGQGHVKAGDAGQQLINCVNGAAGTVPQFGPKPQRTGPRKLVNAIFESLEQTWSKFGVQSLPKLWLNASGHRIMN